MFYEYEHIGSQDYFKAEQYQNLNFPLHLHQCFELIHVDRGTMAVTVDGQTYSLQANQSILLCPHQLHSLSCTRSLVTVAIFSPLLLPDIPTDRLPNKPVFAADPTQVRQLRTTAHRNERKGLLYLIYASLERMSTFRARPSSTHGLLERLFRHIDTHFAEDCSLSATAAALGYTPSYLSRFFKKQVGTSYSDYLCTYRLGHACYLLRTTDDTVLNCAIAAGFTGLRNFNLCFRQQYGLSPSAYRKASR